MIIIACLPFAILLIYLLELPVICKKEWPAGKLAVLRVTIFSTGSMPIALTCTIVGPKIAFFMLI